jgi:hypothetical protein
VEPGLGPEQALVMELLELELALVDSKTADLALAERSKRPENRTVFAVDSRTAMMVEAQELEQGLAVALALVHCSTDLAVADTARMDKALALERCSMDSAVADMDRMVMELALAAEMELELVRC